MSDNSKLELIREAANRPPYKQDVYVNAGQLLAEIEREYLELPILENEPLKVGDKVDGYNQNGAEVVAVMNSKMVVVRSTVKGGNGYHDEAYPLLLWSVDDLKRPQPEVLDADGVPIRVGDTVWEVGRRRPLKVTAVEPGIVSYETEDGAHGMYYAIGNLTHKQPDSLERIDEDAKESVCVYFDKQGSTKCSGCDKSLHPYIECHREMMLDLMKRQREVLERDHER